MINRIAKWFVDWQHRRYLKQMNWTEAQYQRYIDPDRWPSATTVKDYYPGYPYVHHYTTSGGIPWTMHTSWSNTYNVMIKWCNENCQGKWRDDFHRVFSQTAIDVDGSTEEVWFINDLSGGDILCFAFKEEADYLLFLLKWT